MHRSIELSPAFSVLFPRLTVAFCASVSRTGSSNLTLNSRLYIHCLGHKRQNGLKATVRRNRATQRALFAQFSSNFIKVTEYSEICGNEGETPRGREKHFETHFRSVFDLKWIHPVILGLKVPQENLCPMFA